MCFSFEAFKNVWICLVSLPKPNWEVRKMLAACRILRLPGPEISPRSHSGVSVQLLADSSLLKIQDSEGNGSARLWGCPFFYRRQNWDPETDRLAGARALVLSPGSVRMAAPSKHRTYFPAGSHIFQWWHPSAAPVVFCLFWRDAAWLLLLLQHRVVCQWARSINNN